MTFRVPRFCLVILLLLTAVICNGQRARLDSLKGSLLLHSNDTIGVLSATELCFEYRFLNQDSAIYFGKRAIVMANKINYEKGIAQASSDLGVIYYDKGEFKKAMDSWQRSLSLRIKQADSLKMASLHLKIGSLLFKQGQYEQSLVHQLTALEIYRKKNFESGVSYALNNVAAVYEHQHQYDKALDYYRQSYNIKGKGGDNYQLGLTQINIANIYFQKKEYKKAKVQLREAISRLKPLDHATDYLAIGYNNLSDIYSETGQYDSALITTSQALELRRSIKDYQGTVSSLNSMGSILTHLGNYEGARRFLLQALDSAKGRNLMLEKERIYLNLYRLHSQRSEEKEALRNYILYSETKDSLLNETSQKNINELQINYETELKERELSEQQVQLATNALALQKSDNRVVVLLSASLLLLVSGAWVYQRQRAIRKKVEQEAKFQGQLAEAKLENELQQDRLRISRELHDNIGSRLLFLSTAADNLAEEGSTGSPDKVEQVGAFARDTLRELRRTVWLINRDSVGLDELQLKLQEYFGVLSQSLKPRITIAAKADTAVVIRSQKAAAIFRVAQEAVSNAIKHSDAQGIEISLTRNGDMLRLRICDNGRGFDPKTRSGGNGLKNMQAHITEVKGVIRFESGQGQGTTIDVSIPLE